MEQNLVSDEELIKRISDVLKDSKERRVVEEEFDNSSTEKFHDVPENIDPEPKESSFVGKIDGSFVERKDLELENQILASQLEAERRKSRELQSKFELFESSAKYLEKLNGQLETIKQTVHQEKLVLDCQEDSVGIRFDAMQKLRPKTVHTAVHGVVSGGQEDADDGAAISSEPQTEERQGSKSKKREVQGSDLEDLKEFEENLAIVKDKDGLNDLEAEKVFITKTEKKWFEDIGNLASRVRTPLDDKHQKFYEKDRKRFVNRIIMPETQEVDKREPVPADIVSKTKETPVNLTSTELDGLRSYLLQLKELIARRETAWARTTERDYNQRVEITRFKNEVSHLRMLCEKRQKDIKERDQLIVAKDEEIKDLQKKVQALKNAMLKMEKREERVPENVDGLTSEILENSQLVQKSYNVMKRAAMLNKGLVSSPRTLVRRISSGKELVSKRAKPFHERTPNKIKSPSSNSNDEDGKQTRGKSKVSPGEKSQKSRQRSETVHPLTRRKTSFERVDEKLQRIEEMLHSDVLKVNKKQSKPVERKGTFSIINSNEVEPSFQKFALSNGKMRQEVLTAMTGLGGNQGGMAGYPAMTQKQASFYEPKKNQGNAAILANALLAARNQNSVFNY